MYPNVPAPDSQTQSRPAYHRGEWGIDSPRVITSPRGHVHQDAALGLVRPPAGRLVGLAQRRDVARAAVDHRPGRSGGSGRWAPARVTNGGRHRGAKLAEPSSVQRQENRVLTTQSSPPAPQAISWIWMLPVTWLERGRKQASCRPGGSSLAVDGRDVDELPDLDLGADGQPVAGQGHAHRGLEGAEVGVEVVPLVADHHELAGLVGGDQAATRRAAATARGSSACGRRRSGSDSDESGGESMSDRARSALAIMGECSVVRNQLIEDCERDRTGLAASLGVVSSGDRCRPARSLPTARAST